jgi:hypothetical protein
MMDLDTRIVVRLLRIHIIMGTRISTKEEVQKICQGVMIMIEVNRIAFEKRKKKILDRMGSAVDADKETHEMFKERWAIMLQHAITTFLIHVGENPTWNPDQLEEWVDDYVQHNSYPGGE